jgi:hypothetical protein
LAIVFAHNCPYHTHNTVLLCMMSDLQLLLLLKLLKTPTARNALTVRADHTAYIVLTTCAILIARTVQCSYLPGTGCLGKT